MQAGASAREYSKPTIRQYSPPYDRRHGCHSAVAAQPICGRLAVAGGVAQAQAAEAGRGGAGEQDRPDRVEAHGHGRGLQSLISPARIGARRLEISPTRGAADHCSRAGLRPDLARKRGDGVIDRSKTRDTPYWPMALTGRHPVWNSCRGSHLGQRSCATATTGRTYERKRSDQNYVQLSLRDGGRSLIAGLQSSAKSSGTFASPRITVLSAVGTGRRIIGFNSTSLPRSTT